MSNMKMYHSFRNYCRADHGVAAIETAFILPMLLFMFVGMIDLTEMVSSNRKLTQATAVIADVITKSRNQIEADKIKDVLNVINLIMKTGYDGPTEASVRVAGYRKQDGNIVQIWSVAKGSCTTNFTTATLDPLMVPDTSKSPAEFNDIIVAEVCKKFTPFVGNILGEKVLGKVSFDMNETIRVRPRTSNKLTCYNTNAYVAGNECNVNLVADD